MGYSIIIPIYKEEKNIAKMIRKVKYELNNKVKYELVFIDDDSADNSEKIFNKNKNKNICKFDEKDILYKIIVDENIIYIK